MPSDSGHLVERQHLGLALDVELADAAFERDAHLGAGLAHAGEHDPLARHAGGAGPAVFALATTSMPAPSRASSLRTARFELAFIA